MRSPAVVELEVTDDARLAALVRVELGLRQKNGLSQAKIRPLGYISHDGSHVRYAFTHR